MKQVGGHACLDFVNTVEQRGSGDSVEYLNTFDDLISWCRRNQILTPQEGEQLRLMAQERSEEAEHALDSAIVLRETLYRILEAATAKREVLRSDLAQFNVLLARTLMQSRILPDAPSFRWDSKGNTRKLNWMLNPLVRSAAELLTSPRLMRVKTCANSACGRLFLDTSRNGSRRWCDMQGCGNRAKASRFYQRHRQRNRGRTAGA